MKYLILLTEVERRDLVGIGSRVLDARYIVVGGTNHMADHAVLNFRSRMNNHREVLFGVFIHDLYFLGCNYRVMRSFLLERSGVTLAFRYIAHVCVYRSTIGSRPIPLDGVQLPRHKRFCRKRFR